MITSNLIPAAFALLLAAPMGWMAMDRQPCSDVTSEVGTPVVYVGGDFHATFVIQRHKEGCRVVVKQHIFFGDRETAAVIPYDDLVIPSPGPAGPDIWPVALPIAAAVPGPARYRATIFYYKNPLQEWLDWPVTLHVPDLEFDIKEKTNG